MASITPSHNSILKPRTIRSLTSARQSCLINPPLLQTSSRNMSSYPKDKKNPKFGHLPLSTSGPEECALTVFIAQLPYPFSQPTHPDYRSRAQHSSVPPTTTKVAPFHPMNAKTSSSTAYYLLMYRRWKPRSNEPIDSIAAVPTRWRRILL